MKKQVFISYAHADNQPMDDGVPGWVSFFVDKLQRTVARQAGGANVEFWMDHRLEPQRVVNDELKRRIRECDLILAFISPRYLESAWCAKEMATFVTEVGGGLSADRVFMVEVLQTNREHWHVAVQDLSPVKLWASSLINPEPKTLGWPLPNVRADREYWDEMSALASILGRQLQERHASAPVTASVATSTSDPAPAPTLDATAKASVTLQPAAPFDPDAPLSIVINADDADAPFAQLAQNSLGELDIDGYIAPTMVQGQNPGKFREQFEQLLRDNHGVIVVYGVAPPSWVQAKFAEVKKVLALQRKGTWAGILEAPPDPKTPHGLPSRGLMVLDCKQGIDKAELARFIEALKASASALRAS